MKELLLIGILLAGSLFPLRAQQVAGDGPRYVEVTGSAEIEVDPDEIHLIIQIQEYWEEEFARKSKPEDYKTKVPLKSIERELLAALKSAGIDSRDIRVQEIGNSWREPGKEFLMSKQFDLRLTDFAQVDRIIGNVNTKGINSMYIGELKNSRMADYRREGKIEALKAARGKAGYMVAAMDCRLGKVLRIEEPRESGAYWTPRAMSNKMMVDGAEMAGGEEIRKIKFRYEMIVRFEIE